MNFQYILNMKYISLPQYDNLTSGDEIVDDIMSILGWESALGTGLANELDGEVCSSVSIWYLFFKCQTCSTLIDLFQIPKSKKIENATMEMEDNDEEDEQTGKEEEAFKQPSAKPIPFSSTVNFPHRTSTPLKR